MSWGVPHQGATTPQAGKATPARHISSIVTKPTLSHCLPCSQYLQAVMPRLEWTRNSVFIFMFRFHQIALQQVHSQRCTQCKSYIKNYGAEWRWYLPARHLNVLVLLFLTILSSSSWAIQKEKQYFCSARHDLTSSNTPESPSTEIKSPSLCYFWILYASSSETA